MVVPSAALNNPSPVANMTLNQIENFRSQSQDEVPIDPALEGPQQAPTGSIHSGAVDLPLTTTHLRDNRIHLNRQPVEGTLVCNYVNCGIPFTMLKPLQQHVWLHSKDTQRTCKCGRTETGDDKAFRIHMIGCELLDQTRTPTFRIECNGIYGCRRDRCVRNFGKFPDLE